ncbi:hypothetical protein B0I35DRAFT_55595 [Stachybotrys elegans]|uniref:Uncharacterized protein n=1 Tax=Stachybotrys elegans TaxID=80388 RepID=A0A8K0WQ94_9HYPO|nr:hypothetical protein B0I35DRAFT_55595 [Stachybotrys elegans]
MSRVLRGFRHAMRASSPPRYPAIQGASELKGAKELLNDKIGNMTVPPACFPWMVGILRPLWQAAELPLARPAMAWALGGRGAAIPELRPFCLELSPAGGSCYLAATPQALEPLFMMFWAVCWSLGSPGTNRPDGR